MLNGVASEHRHGHRASVPAAGGETTEMRLGGCLIGQVKGLGVILARELEHFVASHVVGAEIGLGADLQVFEIDHRERIAAGTAWRKCGARLGWSAWQRIPPSAAAGTRA